MNDFSTSTGRPARSGVRPQHLRRGLKRAAVAAATVLAVPLAVAGLSAPAHSAAGVGAGYWHTSGNQILDANNNPVRIAGINWYGFETSAKVAHGLYAQDYHDIIDTIKNLGYTTVRLPFSNDVVENPIQSKDIGWANGKKDTNLDLKGLDSLQVMDKIIAYLGQVGIKVILDNHRSDAGNSAEENGLWYTAAYPQQKWLDDWVFLAKRYAGNPTVVGYDLRNEPHTPADTPYAQGATWGSGDPATDWRLAAQTAGNALLAVNPNALILVEGVGETPNASGTMDATWWGGDLALAGQYPVQLSVPNRLVYSPHDYGPRLYRQTWFSSTTTQSSLEAVWDSFWGYLFRQGIAPVMVGEFGTTNNAEDISSTTPGSQGQWFSAMITYLKKNPAMGWTYWAFNGNDDFGLVDAQFDPTPVSATKQQLLTTLQFPLPGAVNPTTSTTTTTGPTPPTTTTTTTKPVTTTTTTTTRPVTTTTTTTTRPVTTTTTTTTRPVTTTTTSGGTGKTCSAAYAVSGQWTGGFQGAVTVTAGTSAISGWKVTWTFANGQTISQAWSATVTSSGSAVTATNLSWNGALGAGANTSFGFLGNWNGTNSVPTLTCTGS